MILSDFQKKAINSIENNEHVLITAHTGSGKTLPAEYAITYYTSKNKRVIYTSPIKALSNQKCKDFNDKFKDIEIGIFTGDNKHNPHADVLIMTTEILHNKLLNPSLTHLDFNLDNVECVIFDEVHYINDSDRGTIWEETIMLLPKHIQMIMLSATIGDKEKFASWIEKIKEKKVSICSTEERVVPLYFYQYFTTNKSNIDKIKDKPMKQLIESNIDKLQNFVKDRKIINTKDIKKCIQYLNKNNFTISKKEVFNKLASVLKNNEMFPCLCFIFSRKQVEEYANHLTTSLFDKNEDDYNIETICNQLFVSRIQNWKEYKLLPEYSYYIKLLKKGIGVHHAGMLPVFREMMEILYDQKYIRILFATETFAIGLNMPTKTVCFTDIKKHDGFQRRLLNSHEFIQMSGRAGRRNIDKVGNVILLNNLFEPIEDFRYETLILSEPTKIYSKFKFGYSLLLQYSLKDKNDIIEFLKHSFMYHQNEINKEYYKNKIETLQIEYESLLNNCENVSICKKYYEMLELLPYKKSKKELQKEIKNIEITYEKDLELYNKSWHIEEDKKKESEYYNYYNSYIEKKFETTYKVLNDNGFYEEEKLLLSTHLHEIHPLVTTDLLLYTNYFKEYTYQDFFSIMSCFYEIKINEPYKSYNYPSYKEEFEFIEKRFHYYQDKETEFELSIYGTFTIQYDMCEYIHLWINECNNPEESVQLLQRIKQDKNIFIGDFIKCCIKLVNISKEIEQACEENLDLVEKCIQGRNSLLKFICSADSLYL